MRAAAHDPGPAASRRFIMSDGWHRSSTARSTPSRCGPRIAALARRWASARPLPRRSTASAGSHRCRSGRRAPARGVRRRRVRPKVTPRWRCTRARHSACGAARSSSSRPGRSPRSPWSPGTRGSSRARAMTSGPSSRRATSSARSQARGAARGSSRPTSTAARAFEQLVLEIRVLAALARAGGGAVGVVGLSLGGLGGPRGDRARAGRLRRARRAPRGPRRGLRGDPHRTALRRARTPCGRAAAAAGARSAGCSRRSGRTPAADRAARPLAVGRDDPIALGAGALGLAAAWGATAPRLYPRGHLTLLFACRALRRDVARFVAGRSGATSSPGCASRADFTSSKKAAGTTSPRTTGQDFSAVAPRRHRP